METTTSLTTTDLKDSSLAVGAIHDSASNKISKSFLLSDAPEIENSFSANQSSHHEEVKAHAEKNPQEATMTSKTNGSHYATQVPISTNEDSFDNNEVPGRNSPNLQKNSRRSSRTKSDAIQKSTQLRKGRTVRKARIADISIRSKPIAFPSNQYEIILTRRAVRKLDAFNKTKDSSFLSDSSDHHNSASSSQPIRVNEQLGVNEHLEIYGDISLGMQLGIISGKVVVQHLKPLDDGRASPSQLTGVISRGDVLLSVNDISLVNQLMAGLDLLSTPDTTGQYQRTLRLRFASGMGLDLLRSSQNEAKNKVMTGQNLNSGFDVGREMLALFPMVDQLSGMPLFGEQNGRVSVVLEIPSPIHDESLLSGNSNKNEEVIVLESSKPVALKELISHDLATFRNIERGLYLREFYTWNSNFEYSLPQEADEGELYVMIPDKITAADVVELGRNAVAGASNLSKLMEEVDYGKDLKSFRSWNTTLSLYSRSSNRRRTVFEGPWTPFNHDTIQAVDEEDENVDTTINDDSFSEKAESENGDEFLVRLASHDEIWRKQVISFLENVRLELDINKVADLDPSDNERSDLNTELSNQLGNFLFGENMVKILKKQKKPRSLPSDEITAMLFDLATKLSITLPSEITTSGDLTSTQNSIMPSRGMKSPFPANDFLLATRFLLDEALPAWFKSFMPLPWEHRRVLWPLEDRITINGSTAASSMSDDVTLETIGTVRTATHSGARKDIASIIEDQEMNTITRAETCFLATLYFTQALLPKLMNKVCNEESGNRVALDCALEFLREYGSYVKLHTCITLAAVIREDAVIDMLLRLAKYDPRHREVMKQTSKVNQLVFYEPTMLSAILQRLHDIKKEKGSDRKLKLIEVCSAAYPDIRPWQVKQACIQEGASPDSKSEEKLYYSYLSLLLHVSEGHGKARFDSQLVAEWCKLSVKGWNADQSEQYRTNFLSVASRASSNHLSYFRDLALLLELSMEMNDYNLSLDIVTEILDDMKVGKGKLTEVVVSNLRIIGASAVSKEGMSGGTSESLLLRIFRLYRKPTFRQGANISVELVYLIEQCEVESKSKLADLISREVDPNDALQAFGRLPSSELNFVSYPVLRILLTRGTLESKTCDLSKSRLKLKRARKLSKMEPTFATKQNSDDMKTSRLWNRMSNGMLSLDK